MNNSTSCLASKCRLERGERFHTREQDGGSYKPVWLSQLERDASQIRGRSGAASKESAILARDALGILLKRA